MSSKLGKLMNVLANYAKSLKKMIQAGDHDQANNVDDDITCGHLFIITGTGQKEEIKNLMKDFVMSLPAYP